MAIIVLRMGKGGDFWGGPESLYGASNSIVKRKTWGSIDNGKLRAARKRAKRKRPVYILRRSDERQACSEIVVTNTVAQMVRWLYRI